MARRASTLLALLVGAATLLASCGGTSQPATTAATAALPTAAAAATPAPTATPRPAAAPATPATPSPATPSIADVGMPVRLKIPSIDVDAPIERVGLDQEGAMDVPQDPHDTAWYKYGPRPGPPGSAVTAGHVAHHDIAPVVFWRLPDLKEGDEIIVVDDKNVERHFVVTGNEAYPRKAAPMDKIFGAASGPRLNLVTCDRESTFDRNRREYANNIVVFAAPKP